MVRVSVASVAGAAGAAGVAGVADDGGGDGGTVSVTARSLPVWPAAGGSGVQSSIDSKRNVSMLSSKGRTQGGTDAE